MEKILPSQKPPGNIPVEKTPLFLCVGFDDNDKSGFTTEKGLEGMKWAVDAFFNRKNPDGTHCSCAFFCTSSYMSDNPQEASHYVKKSWKYAFDKGFEIGCHTHSHPNGSQFTVGEWLHEMKKCNRLLTNPYVEGSDSDDTGIGISNSDIRSFRAPFLVHNNNLFKAITEMGYIYDSSIEEGWQYDQNGKDFFFPYTLDEGSPGNRYVRTFNPEAEEITSHPGLWEIPIQTLIVPPDELSDHFGIETGLRSRCNAIKPYFSLESGKTAGFDYNCLSEFQMTGAEYLATLKHSLDLRLEGNRAPLILGAHTGIYACEYESDPAIKISEAERRKAIEDFLDYAVSKPEVYVVAPMKIIEWMKNPKEI